MDVREVRGSGVGPRLKALLTSRAMTLRLREYGTYTTRSLPNIDAVARALQATLANGTAEERQVSFRALRRRADRAVHHDSLSAETLDWFLRAFVPPRDHDAWRDGLRHTDRYAYVSGRFTKATGVPAPAALYTTAMLECAYRIGPDGRTSELSTRQYIRADEAGVRTFPYVLNTADATLDVLGGGTAGPLRSLGGGLFGTEITLHRELGEHEVAVLEFRTRFHGRTTPQRELRRAFLREAENVGMRITFTPGYVPSRLEQVWWRDIRGPVDGGTPLALDPDMSAHFLYTRVKSAVIGFRWE